MALGSIVIDLLMKTGAFETDTKRASRAMQKLEKDIKDAATKIGLAITAAAGTLTYLINNQLKAADSASKLAQSAGVSIETLTSLGYAADLSGVNTETLGKSLGKLAKNMADANMGTGDAIDAFAALGISVKDSNGNMKSADKVMMEVADQFAKFEDGTNKTAIALKIFGKQGMDLVPMLNAGSAGLSEMQSEAKKLGQVIDKETGKAAEEFNDTLDKIKKTQNGVINQLMVNLLPLMQDLATEFFNFASDKNRIKEMVDGLTNAFKLLSKMVANVVWAFDVVGKSIGAIGAAAVALFSKDWEGIKIIGDSWKEEVRQAGLDLDNIKAKIDALGAPQTAGGGRGFINPALAIPDASKPSKPQAPMITDTDKVKKNLEANLQAIADANTEFQQMQNDVQAAITEIELENIRKRREAEDAGFKAWFEWIDKQQEEAIEAGALIVQYADEQKKKMEEFADNIGASFSSAFNDAILGGKGLSDVFKSLIRDMIAMTARMLILEPLMRNIRAGIAGSSWGSSVSKFFGGAEAGGGDVISGRSYLVGENGPEMFTPRTTGTITPNSSIGTSIVQNINVTTGVAQTVRAEIMSLMPQIVGAAKAAVADSKLRGGSYAMAMR